MTNTKFRKRVLLSSVAMLLVALVALGSATFAWFTQNTTATADNLYAKTIKASTLKIQNLTSGWQTAISYSLGTSSADHIMFPASTANGTSWAEYTALPANAATGAYNAESYKSVTPSTAGTAKFVYEERLDVKNDGDSGSPAITNVIATPTWTGTTAEYARFALVPCTEAGVVQYETGKSFKDYVYAQSEVTYTGRSDNSTTQSITTKTGDITLATSLAAGEAKYFKLFVWFEGQDADCIDSNAGHRAVIRFDVSGTPGSN